jgi:hypothetical protein
VRLGPLPPGAEQRGAGSQLLELDAELVLLRLQQKTLMQRRSPDPPRRMGGEPVIASLLVPASRAVSLARIVDSYRTSMPGPARRLRPRE